MIRRAWRRLRWLWHQFWNTKIRVEITIRDRKPGQVSLPADTTGGEVSERKP